MKSLCYDAAVPAVQWPSPKQAADLGGSNCFWWQFQQTFFSKCLGLGMPRNFKFKLWKPLGTQCLLKTRSNVPSQRTR